MHVVFDVLWHIVIYHEGDVLHIQTTRGNISRNHDADLPVAELVHREVPVLSEYLTISLLAKICRHGEQGT
jgi:hypothetical protein